MVIIFISLHFITVSPVRLWGEFFANLNFTIVHYMTARLHLNPVGASSETGVHLASFGDVSEFSNKFKRALLNSCFKQCDVTLLALSKFLA